MLGKRKRSNYWRCTSAFMTSSPPSKRLLTEEGNKTNVTETEEYWQDLFTHANHQQTFQPGKLAKFGRRSLFCPWNYAWNEALLAVISFVGHITIPMSFTTEAIISLQDNLGRFFSPQGAIRRQEGCVHAPVGARSWLIGKNLQPQGWSGEEGGI